MELINPKNTKYDKAAIAQEELKIMRQASKQLKKLKRSQANLKKLKISQKQEWDSSSQTPYESESSMALSEDQV